MAATALHISISPEKLFSVGGLNVTNSMVTSLIVSSLIIAFAVWVRMSMRKTNRPTGAQNIAEWIVESLTSLIQSVTGNSKKTELFFPVIASFFLFILLNNWFGLLPGAGTIGHYVTEEGVKTFVPYFRAGTADFNLTIALGLITMTIVQIIGVSFNHLGYFKKFINLSSPIGFFVGILEIVSEFSRIISFAFRLFGNVFAGEVLLAVMMFLVPVVVPMPFYGLEIFVGFIQALVFTMLSVVFFNMASVSHESEH